MADERARSYGLSKGRLEAFSDGVFAIAITLLVLEIGVPEGAGDDLLRAVADQWPSYLAYVISFATVGAVWLKHTLITDHLHHADAVVVRLNLLLLLVVSFLPFPTGLIAEYIGHDRAGRISTALYGVVLLLASLVVSLLWRHAARSGLLRPDVPEAVVRKMTSWLAPGLAGYVVMILAGLFLPLVAVLGYLAISLYLLIPFETLRR